MAALGGMETLLEWVAGGTLRVGGSWGGAECLAFVPMRVRAPETAVWVLGVLAALWALDMRQSVRSLLRGPSAGPPTARWIDRLLALAAASMWLYVLHSKIQIHSLVNLLQPCHLSLLLHSLALAQPGPWSTLISLYSLPFVVGAWGAILIPDVSGLTAIETRLFFLQHYFLVLSPLYLLVHRDFAALRSAMPRHFVIANLLIALLHWVVYESVNVTLSVNVNFFLCPTPGIRDLLSALPQEAIWPSYRTILTLAMFVLALIFSAIYVLVAAVFYRVWRGYRAKKEE